MSEATAVVQLDDSDDLRGVLAGATVDAEADKREIFRRLFDEFWPLVRHHLACYLESQEEADEIAAEVFVIAWRKLRTDKPMGLRWFIRTADNKIRDVDRSARSRGRALDALTRRMQDAPDSIHPLDVLALRDAMKALNARERQVVVLTYWDSLNAGEVAEVLHCSTAAVWTTLTRARNKLRTQLDAKEVGP